MVRFPYLFMFLTKAEQALNPCSLFGFVGVVTERSPFLEPRHGCISSPAPRMASPVVFAASVGSIRLEVFRVIPRSDGFT